MIYKHIPLKQEQIEGEVIFNNNNIIIVNRSQRYYMYKNGYRLAELIGGEESLKKTYKGKFENWIEFVRKKDLKKIEKTREEIENLNISLALLEVLWDID